MREITSGTFVKNRALNHRGTAVHPAVQISNYAYGLIYFRSVSADIATTSIIIIFCWNLFCSDLDRWFGSAGRNDPNAA
jgi:hypothetical protein